MNVNLDNLPQSIKSQIPISLRINKASLIYESLPSEIQFILTPYVTSDYISPLRRDILDYSSDAGMYGDWSEFTDLTSTILEYVRNWFKVPIGSYPYDLTFGSQLNSILHTKDSSLQKQLLQNEINTIENLVNNMFPSSFSVDSSNVIPVEFEDHTEYRLEMRIKLLSQSVTINVIQ